MSASSEFSMALPGHAYVPGRTARHPDGAFDALRATAAAGMTPGELARSDAFRAGLWLFEHGFFWEAHEVLEPVWMVLPDPDPERRFVQGIIQVANGYLKLEMRRPRAALRLAGIARGLMPIGEVTCVMGQDIGAWRARIDSLERAAIYVI